VIQDPANQNLILEYFDRYSLEHRREEFDLIVLSAGFKPSADTVPLLRRLRVVQNPYGFVQTDHADPTTTTRAGVFACGTVDGPKDIPESVASASAAAAGVAALLAEHGKKEQPPETPPLTMRDTSGDAPRIGVFVCHCGKNIAGVLPVEELRDFARTLPHVALAENCLFTCSTQTQEHIQELIAQHHLNRVVVAACSPRTHEPLFQETLQQARLNKHLFEMANIRDHCSWVHADDPGAALEKAKALIRGATARVALLEAFDDIVTPVISTALVIGGGLAGMTAALNLADQGIPVVLVEREARLGGMARQIHHTLEGLSPRRMAERTASRVKSHRNIFLYTQSTVKSVTGRAGDFRVTLEHWSATADGGESRPVPTQTTRSFGAVILATGGQPYRPTPSEYLFSKHPGVITQLDLEKQLVTDQTPPPETTVMIQCVGSRRPDFPLCSRICCGAAVKNAIRLLEKDPECRVYVLYRDIRTFGFKEEYYRKARDLGAMFVPFDPETPPEVSSHEGRLEVKVFDPGSQLHLRIAADRVVLSTGVRPPEGVSEIAGMLKLPFIEEGFFLEAHPKLSPLDFSQAGVFVCGLAHSPRYVEESLIQAKGAACRAAGLLLRRDMRSSGIVAQVKRKECTACLVCVRRCPFKVPYIDAEGVSVIDALACQGCGICVAECPAG
ncbi:MAG: FAD-dependent oxidoreductase, partial [Syntrophobacteraceae bacterium]|nr:FAD-dependent oxidoreductase [Syntrophobacteraceae bacterium]